MSAKEREQVASDRVIMLQVKTMNICHSHDTVRQSAGANECNTVGAPRDATVTPRCH